MSEEHRDFEEGEEYDYSNLPENEMNHSGSLESVGHGKLALKHDNQLVEFQWSKVECTDVKYLTDDGEIVEEEP